MILQFHPSAHQFIAHNNYLFTLQRSDKLELNLKRFLCYDTLGAPTAEPAFSTSEMRKRNRQTD